MAGDLTRLQTFLAVYRAGSLTGAAQRLHLSQPAVSKHLRALEVERGRPLFVRGSRGVTPTQDGDLLARQVAPHLDALEGVGARPGRAAAEAPVVHLGGPPDLLSALAVPALAPLVASGALRLRTFTGVAEPVLDRLAADTLDLAVASRPLRRRGIRTEPLFEESLVLVGNAAWAARLPSAVLERDPLAALADVPLIAFDEELPMLRRYWREVFGAVEPEDRPAAVTLGDLRGVARAAAAGAGVAVLPRYLAATALDRGELVLLHRPPAPPRNPIGLAWRPASLRRPGVEAARATLQRAARGWDAVV